jgi:hypothetical protein
MPSNFPNSLDNIPANKTNDTVSLDDHAPHHNDLANAINAIQIALGANLVNVATASQGLKADLAIPSAEKGSANGVAPLDSSGKINSAYLPDLGDVSSFVTTSSSFTMANTTDMVISNASVPIIVTLPDAATVKSYYFINNGSSTMTLNTVNSQTINKDEILIIQFNGSSCRLVSTGSEFYIF